MAYPISLISSKHVRYKQVQHGKSPLAYSSPPIEAQPLYKAGMDKVLHKLAVKRPRLIQALKKTRYPSLAWIKPGMNKAWHEKTRFTQALRKESHKSPLIPYRYRVRGKPVP